MTLLHPSEITRVTNLAILVGHILHNHNLTLTNVKLIVNNLQNFNTKC